MPLTAQQVAEKWKSRMTAAVPAIKEGVLAVTESPMAKAAAKQDSYLAGVQEAVSSGRYRDGLLSVSLDEWKRLTADKGTQRITAGVQAASPVMEQLFAQLLPFAARVKQEIAQMPSGTESASMDRMIANFNKMKQFKFQKRRA